MKKYYIRNTELEVRVGDIFFNKYIITQEMLAKLLASGIIVQKSDIQEDIPPISYFIDCIATRSGWTLCKTLNILRDVSTINSVIPYLILLKEVALFLDQAYPDHIKNSPTLFIINCNGKISEVNPTNIKNFKTFSAFRSYKDATIACRILRNFKRTIFSGGK